jgi:hypothetical protein
MKTQKTVTTITSSELLTILSNVEKPTFTFIVSETKPRMNKTNNPYFDQVFKRSRGKYFIGGSYEDMVRIRQGREGLEMDFVSESCTVGTKVEGTKCLQFNERLNRFYLQYFIFETSKIKSEFSFEENTIDKVLFESFLVKKSTTSRQPQEDKHLPQSFMLSSIKEISLNGNKYIVED